MAAYIVLTGRETGVLFVGYRILYLYRKENAFYRDRKGIHLSMEEKELEESVKVFSCGLPEYYGRQVRWRGKSRAVPWNFARLLRLMQNCCEYVSADACYLEEQFEKELAEGEFGYRPGRQRMCGELIRKIPGRFREIDSVLYLSGEAGELTGELPLPEALLRKLHYFFYLGEKSELYTILEENLWREYGMPLLSVKNMSEPAVCQVSRLLVLDDRPEGAAAGEMLPEGSVYLDLWSNAGRRAQMEDTGRNIKYISEYLYILGRKL